MSDKINLRKLDLKETQSELFNLLLKFDSFCKEHNIEYLLSGGTLLGAIRHQGFIPWDDDIDLMMARPEYEKLKTVLRESTNISICSKDYNNDKKYFFPYLRVVDPNVIAKMPYYERYNHKKVSIDLNLFLDIFPLDGVPSSKICQEVLFLRVALLRKLAKVSLIRLDWFVNTVDNFLTKVFKFMLTPIILLVSLFGHKVFLDRLDNVIKKTNFDKADYVAACTGVNGTKEIMSKNAVAESMDVQFENHTFKAPKGYNEYLTNLYGNYMQLPPEDKRVTHFDGLVFKKEQEI